MNALFELFKDLRVQVEERMVAFYISKLALDSRILPSVLKSLNLRFESLDFLAPLPEVKLSALLVFLSHLVELFFLKSSQQLEFLSHSVVILLQCVFLLLVEEDCTLGLLRL